MFLTPCCQLAMCFTSQDGSLCSVVSKLLLQMIGGELRRAKSDVTTPRCFLGDNSAPFLYNLYRNVFILL